MSPTDDDARRLLRPLAGEPEAPARIHVAAAMRRGGQLRRRRRVATGVAFAAVLAVTASSAALMLTLPGRERDGEPVAAGSASASAGPPFVRSGDLPPAPEGAACVTGDFGGGETMPVATDRSGRWTVTGTGTAPPELWRDGERVGDTPVDGEKVQVSQVNSAGDFAATAYVDNTAQPWVYTGSTATMLPGGAGSATAISAQGRVGGTLGELPVVWDRPDAEPVTLPLPDGYTAGEVVAIGDDEQTVLGMIGTGRTTRITDTEATGSGVLWLPDGETRPLPIPEGADWVRPTAMRDDWVVGLVSDGSAFRYDVAQDVLETLPAQINWPVAVAADGTVAGLSVPTPVVFARGYRAVLLSGGVVRPLRPDDPADTLYELSGLSDDGAVTGVALGSPGRAFTSRCSS